MHNATTSADQSTYMILVAATVEKVESKVVRFVCHHDVRLGTAS